MSSSSRGRLTRLRESAYGELPTPAAMQRVRRTGGSFSHENTLNNSGEVREDLLDGDVQRENYVARGSIEDGWVFGCHGDELQDVFGAAKTAAIDLSALSLTFATAGDTITRGAGSWITDGIVAGGVYLFGGATDPANNGRMRVISVNSAVELAVAKNLVNEGPTAACTVSNNGHYRTGTNVYSSLFEELYADISATELWQYAGAVCTGWTWAFTHPGRMTSSFTYECQDATTTASTGGNGTITAYPANRYMNSIDHFATMTIDGVASTLRVRELSLNYQAPKRRIEAAGTLGTIDMGANTHSLSGQMRVYNSVAARTFADKVKTGATFYIEWETFDDAGNGFHFYLPVAMLAAGSPEMGPKDSDVYLTIPFTCAADLTLATWMQLTEFSAT